MPNLGAIRENTDKNDGLRFTLNGDAGCFGHPQQAPAQGCDVQLRPWQHGARAVLADGQAISHATHP
jgi:hypothetical protein